MASDQTQAGAQARENGGEAAAEERHDPVRVIVVDTTLKTVAIGSFLIILIATLYFGRDFLLPASLAFLFAYVLSPIVRVFTRRGVPEGVSAVLLVGSVLAGIGIGAYFLSGPVAKWVANAPIMSLEIREKVAVLRRPMESVMNATSEVEELTERDDPEAQRVVMSEPGLISRAASGAPEVVAKIAFTLVLLLFLLASGEMFYEKLVKALPTLSDKKRALRIAREVEREVSRYLFTITVINSGLGVVIAFGMWAIGMPNPVLWGIAGAVLNFVPYLGAAVGAMLVTAVAFVSFETLGLALMAPAVYLLCTTLEGQFLTPTVVGRRLELNAVAVFLAVAFWGWLWGIVGALMAVPLLVTVKVFADHVEGMNALGQFLSARDSVRPAEAPAPETPARGDQPA